MPSRTEYQTKHVTSDPAESWEERNLQQAADILDRFNNPEAFAPNPPTNFSAGHHPVNPGASYQPDTLHHNWHSLNDQERRALSFAAHETQPAQRHMEAVVHAAQLALNQYQYDPKHFRTDNNIAQRWLDAMNQNPELQGVMTRAMTKRLEHNMRSHQDLMAKGLMQNHLPTVAAANELASLEPAVLLKSLKEPDQATAYARAETGHVQHWTVQNASDPERMEDIANEIRQMADVHAQGDAHGHRLISLNMADQAVASDMRALKANALETLNSFPPEKASLKDCGNTLADAITSHDMTGLAQHTVTALAEGRPEEAANAAHMLTHMVRTLTSALSTYQETVTDEDQALYMHMPDQSLPQQTLEGLAALHDNPVGPVQILENHLRATAGICLQAAANSDQPGISNTWRLGTILADIGQPGVLEQASRSVPNPY